MLSLKNNVVAGQHADWVSRYARQLDECGKSEQAIHFYRESLRLDANNREVQARLDSLESQSSGVLEGNGAKLASAARVNLSFVSVCESG